MVVNDRTSDNVRVVNPGGCCDGQLGRIVARRQDGSGQVMVFTHHFCPVLYATGPGNGPYVEPVGDEEVAWAVLAGLNQRQWEAYMEADLTFLMGYASCDPFAAAALILRRAEGDGLAEKLAADDAEAGFAPPVRLQCIADTPRAEPRDEACPLDGEMVDFRQYAKGYRGTMLNVASGSYPGEEVDNPLGDTHPDRCQYYLGQSEPGEVWCDHPGAASAPDQERQETYMAVLREVWR